MLNKSPFYLLLISLFIAFSALHLYQAPQPLSAAPLTPMHAFGTIPPTTGCDVNPWQRTSPMVVPRINFVTVQAGEYIYALGGSNSSGFLSSTEYASMNADGTLGSWHIITATMTTARAYSAGVVIGNHIYTLGGYNGSNYLNSVERAEVKTDGTLSNWQPMPSLTTERTQVAAVATKDYLYALGGLNKNNDILNTVERAAIHADGSLGSWQILDAALSLGRYGHAAVTANSYIYALGGYATGASDIVEYAAINPDGTLEPWQVTTALNTKRGYLGVAIYDSHIYALGGSYTGNLSSVEQAAINIDGHLDPWQAVNSLRVERGGLGAITAKGYLYALGGSGNDAGMLNSVEWVATSALGPPPDDRISIKDGDLFTNQTAVTLTISAKPDTVQMQVSNDGGFAGAQWEPCTVTKPWVITQFGNYVIPRVVYIRFKDKSGNISSTFQDDIILDVTPPSGSVTIATPTALSAIASSVNLTLKATDDVSGVGAMIISSQSDFAAATWQPFQASTLWSPGNSHTVYVKFRDNAGNISEAYTAAIPGSNAIYLPLTLK